MDNLKQILFFADEHNSHLRNGEQVLVALLHLSCFEEETAGAQTTQIKDDTAELHFR